RRGEAQQLARRNVEALERDASANGPFDAIVTNAAGCGSTLKEYGERLESDPSYYERARQFASQVRDVTEFLASIELRPPESEVAATVTYQDSCHLAHGQRVRSAPRELLKRIPGVRFAEMPMADLCCGSAGIYNVLESEMSMALLEKKMAMIKTTGATRIVTA